jgi:hypothetical protein
MIVQIEDGIPYNLTGTVKSDIAAPLDSERGHVLSARLQQMILIGILPQCVDRIMLYQNHRIRDKSLLPFGNQLLLHLPDGLVRLSPEMEESHL